MKYTLPGADCNYYRQFAPEVLKTNQYVVFWPARYHLPYSIQITAPNVTSPAKLHMLPLRVKTQVSVAQWWWSLLINTSGLGSNPCGAMEINCDFFFTAKSTTWRTCFEYEPVRSGSRWVGRSACIARQIYLPRSNPYTSIICSRPTTTTTMVKKIATIRPRSQCWHTQKSALIPPWPSRGWGPLDHWSEGKPRCWARAWK